MLRDQQREGGPHNSSSTRSVGLGRSNYTAAVVRRVSPQKRGDRDRVAPIRFRDGTAELHPSSKKNFSHRKLTFDETGPLRHVTRYLFPKKLPPVGGPNSIRKVRFLRFSLERARRRDRRLNECPHAPELLCRQSVGTHLPHAAAQQTTLTPSSTHFFSFLLLVGRRNLPPLRSNWTEARGGEGGGGIAPTSLTQGQTHNTWRRRHCNGR